MDEGLFGSFLAMWSKGAEVPWDLYVVMIVMAIAVIGLWEAFKQVPTEVDGVRWGTGLLRSRRWSPDTSLWSRLPGGRGSCSLGR